MKVNEILTESVAKPKFTGEFPKAVKAISKVASNARRLKNMEEDTVTIKSALEAGEILNTQFKSIKEHANYFVQSAFDNSISWDEVRPANPRDPSPLFDELYGAISVWDVRGMVATKKRLAKVSKEAKETNIYKEAMALIDELWSLVEVLDYLKSVEVMASAKKAEAKAAKAAEEGEYQKKYTDHKDVKKVVSILKQVSSEVESDLATRNAEWMKQAVTKFQKEAKDGNSDYMEIFKRDGFSRLILQSLCQRVYPKGAKPSEKHFELIKNWEGKLDEMAKKDAATVVDKFVFKNSGKLSYIIYNKNNLKKVTLKNTTVRVGAVEAVLHLEFADGSEFVAESTVEMAYSVLGKPFYRYPTRFRNVKLPDGSKLAQPSEQRMDEVFAITK
jgi:hypothetical protein